MQLQVLPSQRAVAVADLKLGMFICNLDRPWIETRFLFQGFSLTNTEDLEELRRLCRYVIIDTARGVEADRYLESLAPPSPQDALETILQKRGDGLVYKDTVSLEEELGPAREIYNDLNEIMGNIMEDVRSRKKTDFGTVRVVVNGLIGSVLRNPDAFMWLSKLKQKDAYTYVHSIDACSLAVAFGRHLGLPQAELEHLAVGTLLFDVGKMRLPKDLLSKPGRLTEQEFQLMRKHVEYSVQQMQAIDGICAESIEVAQHHHERFNGQGYPHGLKGTTTPIYGRIAGLVDCYDAITSDRPYSPAISQHDAIKKLYEWRNVDFQETLVEQFIQCLGIYPTGSMVELSTGEVGVVLAQNRVRRLRPKVLLILDENKVAYDFSPVKDLATETIDKHGQPLEISQPLEPASYGIDPKDYYL